MEKYTKILIIRFSSIGDIVLTSPVIRCVKEQTGADIYFLTKPAFYSLVRNNPYVTKTIKYEDGIINHLKNEEFDLVIDLHNNFRSFKIKTILGVKSVSFNKLNVRKWLQVNFKMDALPEHKHLVDRYFEGLEEVGIQNDGKGLDFYVDANIKDKSNQIIKKLDKYCCLVLGANYYTKRIPLEKCMEIVDKSNLHVMLIGGKDVAPIASALNNTYPEKIINMCGQINIQQSAVMIKSAEYIITGDTGMMHIAAAYQKRIYVLWGNTIPAFGMYPYYGNKYPDRHVDLEVPDLKCRPCSKLGYNSCPKDHFACMMNQNVRQIISP